MKKILVILILLFNTSELSSGQIEIREKLTGYSYFQDSKRISMNEVFKLMEPDTKSYHLMKSARSDNTVSTILGGLTGACLGYTLGNGISGKSINWNITGLGIGLATIGIPLSKRGYKRANQVIEHYNTTINQPKKMHLELIANRNGIGIEIQF